MVAFDQTNNGLSQIIVQNLRILRIVTENWILRIWRHAKIVWLKDMKDGTITQGCPSIALP